MGNGALGNLEVTPAELRGVGTRVDDIASNVRTLYTNMMNALDAVTGNDAWKSEASDELDKSVSEVRKPFEDTLGRLERLGGKLSSIGDGYQKAEDENTAGMKEEQPWEQA
jgi:WXG100 family type VII secretion target